MISDRLSSPPIRPEIRFKSGVIRIMRQRGAFVVLLALFVALMPALVPAVFAQPPQAIPPRTPRRATGTLRVIVVNAARNSPASNVSVRTDSSEERPRSALTGPDGVATIRLFTGTYAIVLNGAVALPDQLETREEFTTKGRRENIVIREDQLTTVTFYLDERILQEEINRRIELIDRNETGEVTRRTRRDFFEYPLAAGNRQSLSRISLGVPGFVYDAVEQTHVRGESSINKATVLDGVLLPSVPAGAMVPVIIPDALDAFNARVGGFSAQYGGGSGAVMELESRKVHARQPILEFAYRNGDNSTHELYGNFGGVLPRIGSSASFIKGMDYTVTLSQRYTDQGTEAPGDVFAGKSNNLASENLFAKLNFDIGKNSAGQNRTISTLLNFSSGRSGIAARTGLYDNFAPYGAGFGFLGQFSSSDRLRSQNQLGQDFGQKDNNNLIVLQFKSSDPDGTDITGQRQIDRGVFSLGYSSNTRTERNIGGTTPVVSVGKLPENNSIDFLPTVLNDYEHFFIQGDVTPRPSGRNQWKMGIVYQGFLGKDSLQLIPQSQLAVNELFQLDPRLVAAGSVVPGGKDIRGNSVYKLSGNDPQTPIMYADKDGYYAAAYIQDAYQVRSNFKVNVGLRVDTYSQQIKTSSTLDGKELRLPNSSGTALSPRLNMALKLPENGPWKFLDFITKSPTLVRASYNRIFTPPHMNQGVFLYGQRGNNYLEPNPNVQLADSVQPQIVDQFDVSVERQMTNNSILKIGAYTKSIKNTLVAREIIPAAQYGLLSVFNVGKTNVTGTEVSFRVLPPAVGVAGIHGFISYANSASARANNQEFNNLGQQVVGSYNEHDQANTLTTSVAYSFRSGASIGLSYYFGDGLYSSKTNLLFVPIRSGDRQKVSEFNLRLATPPSFLFGKIGAEFMVYNLFDSRSRLEWAGPYGTRYQLGRQVYVALTGHF